MSGVEVTVVILNYNSEEYTRRCLRSVFAHSRPGGPSFEVVVVDNGSREFDGAALAREFPAVEVLTSPVNLGFGGGCNLGAAGRTAKYLYFLNNDTLFLNDVLRPLRACLDGQPEVGVCGAQQFDGDLRPVRSTRTLPRILGRPRVAGTDPPAAAGRGTARPGPAEAAKAAPGAGVPDGAAPVPVEGLSGANLLIRTALFHEVGGFDPRIFLYHEEDDLAVRVARAGRTLALVPAARLQHFHGKSSPAKLGVLMEDAHSLLYYFRKHAGPAIAWLARLRLAWTFAARGTRYGLRRLAGRDPRGLGPAYARLLAWALAGFPESTVLRGRGGRPAEAPGSGGPASTGGTP